MTITPVCVCVCVCLHFTQYLYCFGNMVVGSSGCAWKCAKRKEQLALAEICTF